MSCHPKRQLHLGAAVFSIVGFSGVPLMAAPPERPGEDEGSSQAARQKHSGDEGPELWD
jgi:hypothetical protein